VWYLQTVTLPNEIRPTLFDFVYTATRQRPRMFADGKQGWSKYCPCIRTGPTWCSAFLVSQEITTSRRTGGKIIILVTQKCNWAITVLYIIHRPVFYLKLNSTVQVCPYLTANTLRLRYESNRLMLSADLWRLYIIISITILDIIHSPVFYLKQCFGDWILSPSSGGTYSVGPRDRD
jgi:hypothetical protein